MGKNNAHCLNCGKGYYVCRSCESIWSWKQVACSPECFRELQEKMASKPKIDNVERTKEKGEETKTLIKEDAPLKEKVVSKPKKAKTSTVGKTEK